MTGINKNQRTDVCLIVEGSYPYVTGGVAAWVHDLIISQPDVSFSVVCIVPDQADMRLRYELPKNVKLVQNVIIRAEPSTHQPSREDKKVISEMIATHIKKFSLQQAGLKDLQQIIEFLQRYGNRFDIREFLDSEEGWDCMVKVYNDLLAGNSFIDYFWSFRSLLSGFYAVMAAELPYAKVYHATCTGFAGLLGARANQQTGSPLIISEHGIYTNERRIEIASVDWLESQNIVSQNLTIDKVDQGLRDLWLGMFISYSRIAYESAAKIITLFKENQELQKEDGASAEKMAIIPNGINVGRFMNISRKNDGHPPTVALIGRVVPIKDVKTFIRAVHVLKDKVPDLRAWVIGPMEEDEDYAEECRELTDSLRLQNILSFTGSVKVDDYLPEVDVVTLTSISEAQPLVILEAGAAGIPCVATDVGNCRELLHGTETEQPMLGQGGLIVPISNPQAVAEALADLLIHRDKHHRLSEALRARVKKYYDRELHNRSYNYLYSTLIAETV